MSNKEAGEVSCVNWAHIQLFGPEVGGMSNSNVPHQQSIVSLLLQAS